MAYNPYTGEDDTQPINLENDFNTQVAENINYGTLSGAKDKFTPQWPVGSSMNFGVKEWLGNNPQPTKADFVEALESGQFGGATTGAFGKNVDELFGGTNLDAGFWTTEMGDVNPKFIGSGDGFGGNIDINRSQLSGDALKALPKGFWRDDEARLSNEEYLANERYASVPEGMRETISDASYKTERDLGYDYPGYDQFKNPQQYYMENKPKFGYDDSWYDGPISTTGRKPDKGGYIEYQELARHPTSWQERGYSKAEMEEEADLRRNLRSRPSLLTTESEYNPILQRALINRNRQNLYGNEGIGAVDIQENITEQAPLDTSRFQNMYWGPSSEENEEEVVSKGITGPNKWQKFLSKITRQPYRPAMGGVTMGSGRTYSPAQLNKMNALGGWYSEPSRAARRTEKRVADMLARRAQGKSYSEKNLKELSGGKYDFGAGKQGSYTAATTPAPAGVTTSSGMHGGKHYVIGGRVGYNQGGRVGILSVF